MCNFNHILKSPFSIFLFNSICVGMFGLELFGSTDFFFQYINYIFNMKGGLLVMNEAKKLQLSADLKLTQIQVVFTYKKFPMRF